MHGLGNDFVVIDCRARPLAISAEGARALANRHTGIGCDQLVLIEPARSADIFMRIYNSDGGEVGACGNATRCVGSLLLGEDETVNVIRIETIAAVLEASAAEGGQIAVDMGVPGAGWRDVPLSTEADTLHLDLARDGLSDPVALSMGNPHCVFFVDDIAAIALDEVGPTLEHDPIFPERANIGIAQITGRDTIRLRVWERGAGITQACGTGACAAAVAGARRDLTGRAVTVTLDGGSLHIDWRDDDHVIMTGPVATSYTGSFDTESFPGVSPS